jgi:hypothetical protein
MYEHGTLKPAEVILRGMARRENNGGDEPNWGIIYIAFFLNILILLS